jgi:hypothetical protein
LSTILNILSNEEQYRLHAYVCAPSCVKWSDTMGTVSFPWVYNNRPDDCRYAIAGTWDEKILVWDLYNVATTRSGKLLTPKPKRVTSMPRLWPRHCCMTKRMMSDEKG